MRVFLDECVDRRLARDIAGHDVRTARDMNWRGIKNGELLLRASREFDVFVTVDRNLSMQQNISSLPLAVIVLCASSNRLADLKPLVSDLLRALDTVSSRALLFVGVAD